LFPETVKLVRIYLSGATRRPREEERALSILLLLSRLHEAAGARAIGAVPGEDWGEPDEALIRKAQADRRAFGPLYERYHDRIYRYCYMRLNNREAAEDATAETFLKGLANLGRLRPGSVLLAWLYTLARHAVADHYQKQRPVHSLDERDAGTGGLEDGAVSGGLPHLDRLALAHALAQLPAVQRGVLELQLAGWTVAESAAALGKTEAAVKMMRYRAVERLQQLLVVEEEDRHAGDDAR
jgi:RNA polymerase sigma-70 factor (ECF subfamily)